MHELHPVRVRPVLLFEVLLFQLFIETEQLWIFELKHPKVLCCVIIWLYIFLGFFFNQGLNSRFNLSWFQNLCKACFKKYPCKKKLIFCWLSKGEATVVDSGSFL